MEPKNKKTQFKYTINFEYCQQYGADDIDLSNEISADSCGIIFHLRVNFAIFKNHFETNYSQGNEKNHNSHLIPGHTGIMR